MHALNTLDVAADKLACQCREPERHICFRRLTHLEGISTARLSIRAQRLLRDSMQNMLMTFGLHQQR